jgi:hypothetical protein
MINLHVVDIRRSVRVKDVPDAIIKKGVMDAMAAVRHTPMNISIIQITAKSVEDPDFTMENAVKNAADAGVVVSVSGV